MERLEGKVALVTGGARGLGEAIARRFYDEGATVHVNDLDGSAAEVVARQTGGRGYGADVADPDQVRDMFEHLGGASGRLDILVNNAGISGLEGRPDEVAEAQERTVRLAEEIATGAPITAHSERTLELSDDDWRRMIAVHLDGTFFCSREALRLMIAKEVAGNIINMGSIMGTAGGSGSPHYCAAKAGILGLTRSLALEQATRGIRVNAIAPGWITTEMTNPLDQMRPMLEAQTPLLRFGEPDDIAWAAVYLASDQAQFVTGQVLSPNGGWVMSQ